MSYFSNAYRKSFVGTKATQAGSGTTTAVDDGFIIAAGIATSALSNTAAPNTLGPGTYGFFDPATYLSVTPASAAVTGGRPLILAGSSLYANDKIGPFHGGYKESNKSKMINPKYINKWARMTGAGPEQAIYHVGNTNLNSFTATGTLTITTAGAGYTNGAYTNVLLTTLTGSGAGLIANITVAGGVVTVATIVSGGQGYAVTDTVTVPTSIVGSGTGNVLTIATIKYDVSGNTKCAFEFLCGETYNLQFNLFGAQVLRYLNHDLYKTLAAYTGCCPTGSLAPTPVDSTLVMINWADQVINDVWMKDFIQPIVYSQSGVPMFATTALAVASLNGIILTKTDGAFVAATDGTYTGVSLIGGTGTGATANVTVAAGLVSVITLVNPGTGYTVADALSIPAGILGVGQVVPQTLAVATISAAATAVNVWTNYVSPGYIAGTVAGLRFIGAYVETKFGNCSFQKTDYFDQEIVQMILSMVDLDGNPCNANLCTKSETAGFVGQGSGEVVLRDVILDESYLQNYFASNSRIREITQGDQLFTAVPRNIRYTRYILNHSVPRYNNPTGIYDDDQYSLNIYVPTSTGTAASLETFVDAWLAGATSSVTLETFDHTPIVPAVL
jgi:hypothetical protein